MLQFSKSVADEQESANGKAQALLAMLGEDASALGFGEGAASGGAISDERLRSLARHLIAQVEQRKPGQGRLRPADKVPPLPESVPAAPKPNRIPDEPGVILRRSVFRSAAPLAQPEASPHAGGGSASPPVVMAVPSAPAHAARIDPLHSESEVRRLIAEGLDPAVPGREHPAVIALTLADRPPLEQAAALRKLPRGQVRTVHRALRLLEADPAVPVAAPRPVAVRRRGGDIARKAPAGLG